MAILKASATLLQKVPEGQNENNDGILPPETPGFITNVPDQSLSPDSPYVKFNTQEVVDSF